MVDSREAVTPEGKRVVIAGVRMMCQSVKTVQHYEKGVTSVTSKTISRTCVFTTKNVAARKSSPLFGG